MATNSSNPTTSDEVGWQAAPNARGTADILWSCTSVILLITWTSFHSSVGIARKQRIFTTITAILVPQLSALVAFRDMRFAHRIHHCLKHNIHQKGWKEGWTLTKSFLVVKGGIRVSLHREHPSTDSSSAPLANTATDGIIDPETFFNLAILGIIRYEDLPTAEEINDKSKADWFAKITTLFQLVWAVFNIGCRRFTNYPISLLELMTLDWIIFGLLATILWWKCPKNLGIPFNVPVQDPHVPSAAPPTNRSSKPWMEALHDHFAEDKDYFRTGLIDTDEDFSLRSWILMVFFNFAELIIYFIFGVQYKWHQSQADHAWVVFETLSMVSGWFLFTPCLDMHSLWSDRSIHERYIQSLWLEAPHSGQENYRRISKWVQLARGMGIFTSTNLKRWQCAPRDEWHDTDLKLLIAVIVVILLSQSAKLVISLLALASAPQGLYNVPEIWFLEALVHVGG